MASKKKWKKRALRAEKEAHELFSQATARATELAQIDMLLREAEFPGPTFDAWAAQVSQLLTKLVEMRGIQPKDPRPFSMVSNSGKEEPVGEYSFLTDHNAT